MLELNKLDSFFLNQRTVTAAGVVGVEKAAIDGNQVYWLVAFVVNGQLTVFSGWAYAVRARQALEWLGAAKRALG